MVHSGVVAFSIPAVDELTFCSPSANSMYGAALPKTAATAMCAHKAGERGSGWCRTATMASSTMAPSTSRAKVTSTGESPWRASLIHRKLEPQTVASSASRAVVDRRTSQAARVPGGHPGSAVRGIVVAGEGVERGQVLVGERRERGDPLGILPGHVVHGVAE